MFIVGEVVIDEDVAHARFSCDLARCKGACCTLPGGRGAPLTDEETGEILRSFPAARNYLPEEHLRAIESRGMFEGEPGNYTTSCVGDRDCVFVYYEGDVARCSLEKAWMNGETEWRKPISCHLFPIRVSPSGAGMIRYEQITECAPGRDSGRGSDIRMAEFLKEALVRRYGEPWYAEFLSECLRRDPSAIRGPAEERA